MKRLLYVDACFRGKDSRTRRIAMPILEALSSRYEVQTVDLNALELQPLQKASLDARFHGQTDPVMRSLAERVRDADLLVIAAPFWDMSFPSALKVFFERCSLLDVTFCNGEKGCTGNCRAEKLLYVTTRGMDISTGDPLEQATPYLRALARLWGIGEVQVVSAQNMDYVSVAEAEAKIAKAISEGLDLSAKL